MGLRQRLCTAAGLLAASALAGCSFAPPYQPPAMTIPQAYAHLDGWAPAQPADDLPRGKWWESFGDPLLNDLEGRIEGANPQLASALARYDQARGFAAEARSGLMPSVVAEAPFSTDKQSADRPLRGVSQPTYYPTQQLDGVLSYELDFWGRIRNEVASRKALAQASAADMATLRLALQADLAADYAQVRGLDDQTKLLQDTIAAFQRAYQLTETMYQGKIAAVADVARARAQLAFAQAQLSETAASRALLVDAIAALVGEPASTFSLPAGAGGLRQPTVPTGLPSALLQRRPDIASAERAVFSANAEIGVARAAFFPTITLNGTAGFQSSRTSLLQLANSFWTLGPGVTLPIFQGGLLTARKQEAYARFRQASADYRTTVLAAFSQVEDARAQLAWLAQEHQALTTAVSSSNQALDAAMALYKDGATDYLGVVTAQTSLLQAQEQELQLKTRLLGADVSLVRALGGTWSADSLS